MSFTRFATPPLDPGAVRVLELMRAAARPPFETLSAEEARFFYAAGRPMLQPDPEPVAETRDLAAPGPAGPVKLRLYRGHGCPAGDAPVLVFFHGGGWVIGDLDSHDQACRRLANETRACVIAVDYRLAPEHRFPAAILDSAAALRWIAAEAAALGIDAGRLAVGGDSAGGNIAAVMAIMARDGDLPPIRFQALIYPATDMAMTSASVQRVTDGYPLTAGTMRWFIGHYLAGRADVTDWRASPLRATDLGGVAPAWVLTCSHDPLADEGAAYARRLEAEGVRVSHLHMADQMHGFLTMGRFCRAADVTVRTVAIALGVAWAEAGRPG
jgi:acetyl esterase